MGCDILPNQNLIVSKMEMKKKNKEEHKDFWAKI